MLELELLDDDEDELLLDDEDELEDELDDDEDELLLEELSLDELPDEDEGDDEVLWLPPNGLSGVPMGRDSPCPSSHIAPRRAPPLPSRYRPRHQPKGLEVRAVVRLAAACCKSFVNVRITRSGSWSLKSCLM